MNVKAHEKMDNYYRKRLSVIAGLAISLVVFFVIGTILKSNQRSVSLGGIAQFVSENADIEQVVISSKTEGEISLEEVDDLWTIQGGVDEGVYRARTDRVEDFLAAIFSAQFTRRVSKDADDLAFFGLQGNTGSIGFFDSQKRLISRLYFGNQAEQLGEQYFRIEDLTEVYALNTELQFYLDQSPIYWTDLRLWEVAEDVMPVTFYRTYTTVAREDWYRNEDAVWETNTGEPAPSEVATAATALLQLEGEAIVDALPNNAQYLLTVGIETDNALKFEILIYSVQSSEPDQNNEIDSFVQYYLSPSAEGALRSPTGALRTYTLPEWRYEGLIFPSGQ